MMDLSRELQQLAERARQRTIGMEEMQGGTFTISNQGSVGGSHFTPIINIPEVAILGVGRGKAQTISQKGKTENRTMLPLTLSYDHRVIDGGDAARFISALSEQLAGFDEADIK
jgi:pyruvate dehydrogenase E2 component (dihydrolipoamide acetyltransferase)